MSYTGARRARPVETREDEDGPPDEVRRIKANMPAGSGNSDSNGNSDNKDKADDANDVD